ncbi:MAG: hypothetical protein ACR5K2_04020 [Wolbachia sp.]
MSRYMKFSADIVIPNPNGKLKSFSTIRDLGNLLYILFNHSITKVGITFMLKKFTNEEKAKEAQVGG